MKFLFTFAILFAFYSSQAQTVINDGNVEQRNVGAFSGIKVSGGISVYLSQSNDYALAVSASEDKFRDAIVTEIKNGILHIYYNGSSIRINDKKNLRVYLSFKTLESIEASGASNVILTKGLELSDLRLTFSGASDMSGNLICSNVALKMSGASTLKISGKIENLRVDASGASDLKNFQLVVENCIVKISGASDLKLTVNNSLSVKASGASSVLYKGNPRDKDVDTTGASSVSQAN